LRRILAIDYGTKRSGIAITDPMQIIASGLCTVLTQDLIAFLKKYTKDEEVSTIVLGAPKQMDNTDSESEVYIKDFIAQLQREIPSIAIARQDERFTSKLAVDAMIRSGVKKKKRQNKALIDEISATIILQDYLKSTT
jgi:putative Holliday junction resolvase